MGAWIEIIEWAILSNIAVLSHPTMGAWIEILLDSAYVFHIDSRTPRWVRGLKW